MSFVDALSSAYERALSTDALQLASLQVLDDEALHSARSDDDDDDDQRLSTQSFHSIITPESTYFLFYQIFSKNAQRRCGVFAWHK